MPGAGGRGGGGGGGEGGGGRGGGSGGGGGGGGVKDIDISESCSPGALCKFPMKTRRDL